MPRACMPIMQWRAAIGIGDRRVGSVGDGINAQLDTNTSIERLQAGDQANKILVMASCFLELRLVGNVLILRCKNCSPSF